MWSKAFSRDVNSMWVNCRINHGKIGLASALALFLLLKSSFSLAETDQSSTVSIETVDNLPGHNIYRPADMTAREKPLPVITWANGGCVRHDRTWKPLFSRWAEEGFLVITIAQPPGVEGEKATQGGRSTPGDQAAAIDWAVEENNKEGSPYAGLLDVERIVAAGNSCGGITSLALAGQDSRVKSVFVLSGSSVGPGAKREDAAAIMNRVSVPVGFVVGGPEDIASDQADQDYDLLADGLASMVVKRISGDHRTVSTDPAMLSDAANIAINWIKGTLYGDKTAIKDLTEAACSQCEAGVWTVKTKNL